MVHGKENDRSHGNKRARDQGIIDRRIHPLIELAVFFL
jgi:hypothetical protein